MHSEDRKIFTVTALTRDIRSVLEGAFGGVWVEGEISNLKAHFSGHSYFSLKDDACAIKCVLFRNAASRVKFTMEDGMQALCFGKISVYDKQGQYQLYVETAEPMGKGALYVAFEQLKKKLEKEGLFDAARKKDIPFLPMRIGVVTSPAGAAVHDILAVARKRFANIEITICPVKVQGDGAAGEIARAIADLNEYNDRLAFSGSGENPIDVIISGRGGGSMEDLWAFNEEAVARAIASSMIPVISAVGHEIDYTISDFVADRRAATPSHAAEMVIREKAELISRIGVCGERMESGLRAKLGALTSELSALGASYVLREPANALAQLEQQLDELSKRSGAGMAAGAEAATSRFAALGGKLEALNPLSILNRGYSITFKDGGIVKKAADLASGDIVVTRFLEGEVSSRVEKVLNTKGVRV